MSQYLSDQTERLQKNIKHIVVLMLENRSFDNLLGWLYYDQKPNNNQEFEGLNYGLWNPLNNIDSDGIPFIEKVGIEQNGEKKYSYGKEVPNPENFCLPCPDPGEGFKDTNHQLFSHYNVAQEYPPDPVNMGFVQNYQNAMLYGTYSFGSQPSNPRDIMKCYTPAQTPILSGLAKGFAVCDHYHCSIPSQTLPNRSFVHAATSGGNVNNTPNADCSSKTIYQQIQEAIDTQNRTDLSWGIFGNNLMSTSEKKKEEDKLGEFGKDYFSLTRLCMTGLHDPKFDSNFDSLDSFFQKCQKGTIPSYSFLEPTYGGEGQNDQHPPTDIRTGEKLIADVYNAVKNSKVFENTLLIVTYDEHGGCYDHVPPPGEAVNPDPNNTPGQDGFLFNRFGVRVPCVLINPYISEGLIARPSGYVPYDHTSIIKTVQECFQLDGNLTERDKAAPSLSGVLTESVPRTTFPDLTPLSCDTKVDVDHVNDLHRVMAKTVEKLTGTKKPDQEKTLTYLQKNFNKLFIKKPAKSS
ncbi:alkaline phosphatase family protein [Algoriphagus machipongonensis]|uniref:Phosphoesterase family protein n=1 Tax=Algoriphagus machipongonensis TaxID=388413 RepID=A3HSZ5_9BACT|nr:alkaline phosphatase family protein [Algoriphagus machipongonensis]EAZ82963.1 phosphoesterase family protein [Algoriphagus machipongonensis]